MKYIDADKLIAEIERLRRVNIKDADNGCNIDQCDGYELCLTHIESFIQYLQQEQPKFKIGDTIHKNGENTVFPMTIERISDGDYVCDGGKCFVSIKFQDDYELVEQKQPEVELEKFTEKINTFQGRYKYPEIISIKGAMGFMARLFYQYPNVARQWYDSLPKATMD